MVRANSSGHRLMRLLLAVIAAVLALAAPAAAAQLSAGCGRPAGEPPIRYEIGGRERQAIVAVPKGYDPATAHALVVAFHGRTSTNAQVRSYFGLEAAASRPTLYVYPAALTDKSDAFAWYDPGDASAKLRDFVFFDAILERMGRSYCLDLDAVFVVGHSLGASFANSLACARADRIRGLASVAGGIYPSRCGSEVAVLLLHNPADKAVPISQGLRAREVLLGDPLELHDTTESRLGAFDCEEYRAGADPLLWCPYHQSTTRRGSYYPHLWPSGANVITMSFFAKLEDRPLSRLVSRPPQS